MDFYWSPKPHKTSEEMGLVQIMSERITKHIRQGITCFPPRQCMNNGPAEQWASGTYMLSFCGKTALKFAYHY